MVLTEFLASIADAIRTKEGTGAPILANDFPQKIYIQKKKRYCKEVSRVVPGAFQLHKYKIYSW